MVSPSAGYVLTTTGYAVELQPILAQLHRLLQAYLKTAQQKVKEFYLLKAYGTLAENQEDQLANEVIPTLTTTEH
ncbi:hypothetical protein FGIG_04334 [Fasciola gigantica]|uniref:Uncharacterized protein n=1 Tax=Fasciola gigantica TaxID=46835 RepID=A0A504YLS3_FASGI|nr:hypothetical protein FGIG_04334 [Fasciola gigantica]